jgi:hypothetical protein
MANEYRVTGSRYRFDGDDQMWHAKMRVQQKAPNVEKYIEFATQVATLLELLAWIADILNGLALSSVDATVAGHPATVEVKAAPAPDP